MVQCDVQPRLFASTPLKFTCQIDDLTKKSVMPCNFDPAKIRRDREFPLNGVYYVKTRDKSPYFMDIKDYEIEEYEIDTSAVSVFNKIECFFCPNPFQSKSTTIASSHSGLAMIMNSIAAVPIAKYSLDDQ